MNSIDQFFWWKGVFVNVNHRSNKHRMYVLISLQSNLCRHKMSDLQGHIYSLPTLAMMAFATFRGRGFQGLLSMFVFVSFQLLISWLKFRLFRRFTHVENLKLWIWFLSCKPGRNIYGFVVRKSSIYFYLSGFIIFLSLVFIILDAMFELFSAISHSSLV